MLKRNKEKNDMVITNIFFDSANQTCGLEHCPYFVFAIWLQTLIVPLHDFFVLLKLDVKALEQGIAYSSS